jgi:hypothetical protein
MRWRWRTCREAIGQRLKLVEGALPRETKPLRCTSSELFFSCCDSVAALPALANCNERRGATGNGLGATIKYLCRTASGAAGCDLGTTIKYLRGATSIGLGTPSKYLQRATSAGVGNGLGTTINYLRGTASISLGTAIKYLRRAASAAAATA